MKITDYLEARDRLNSVLEECKEYCKNKTIPLDTRWDIYCAVLLDIPTEYNYFLGIESVDAWASENANLFNNFTASYFDLVNDLGSEQIENCTVEELKEAILENWIDRVEYD